MRRGVFVSSPGIIPSQWARRIAWPKCQTSRVCSKINIFTGFVSVKKHNYCKWKYELVGLNPEKLLDTVFNMFSLTLECVRFCPIQKERS